MRSSESIQAYDAWVSVRRPFVTEVPEVLFDIRFQYVCGHHYVRCWPSFSFRAQVIGGPTNLVSRYEDLGPKHVKLQRLHWTPHSSWTQPIFTNSRIERLLRATSGLLLVCRSYHRSSWIWAHSGHHESQSTANICSETALSLIYNFRLIVDSKTTFRISDSVAT